MIYTFRLDVRPGDVSNNSRMIPRHGRLVDSPQYRAGLTAMALQVSMICAAQKWRKTEAPVVVDVVTLWPTHAGDVEATSKAALDCLEKGGLLKNDRQVVRVTYERGIDKARPGLVITVRPWDGGEQ